MGITLGNWVKWDEMGIKTIDELGMDEMGSYVRHKPSSFFCHSG